MTHKNRITLVLGLILLVGFVLLQLRGGGAAESPAYFAGSMDLAAATARAAEQNRPVLAVATADWCGPCQAYKRSTLASAAVAAAASERTVPILLDVTERGGPASEDAARLGVSAIPATFLIAPDGRVLERAVGGLSEGDLLAMIDRAAAALAPAD